MLGVLYLLQTSIFISKIWYVDMSDVTADSGRLSNLIEFFGNFYILLHV